MSEPKPLASLSPSLLARKGSARPAMRPQIQPLNQYHDALARQIVEDDLGWNDMGHEEAAPPVAETQPELRAVSVEQDHAEAPVPEVVRQQETIAERIAPEAPVVVQAVPVQAAPAPAKLALTPEPRPVATDPASRARRSALTDGRRAAFTLRMDADRHLKLRLACTLRNRSAQQIVTEALDLLLDALPEVSSLAAQVAVKR
jgi:hypothetical protein